MWLKSKFTVGHTRGSVSNSI